MRQVRPPPLWASLLGGAGAGAAVAGFLAAPWPWGLLAVPGLAAWAWLLTLRRDGRQALFLLVGVVAVLLAVGTGFLLGSLG